KPRKRWQRLRIVINSIAQEASVGEHLAGGGRRLASRLDKLWPQSGRSFGISTRGSERKRVAHTGLAELVNAGRLLAGDALWRPGDPQEDPSWKSLTAVAVLLFFLRFTSSCRIAFSGSILDARHAGT